MSPDATLRSVTLILATTDPLGSVTAPLRVANSACAQSEEDTRATNASPNKKLFSLFNMEPLFNGTRVHLGADIPLHLMVTIRWPLHRFNHIWVTTWLQI